VLLGAIADDVTGASEPPLTLALKSGNVGGPDLFLEAPEAAR